VFKLIWLSPEDLPDWEVCYYIAHTPKEIYTNTHTEMWPKETTYYQVVIYQFIIIMVKQGNLIF
jgi:hypothetical protein